MELFAYMLATILGLALDPTLWAPAAAIGYFRPKLMWTLAGAVGWALLYTAMLSVIDVDVGLGGQWEPRFVIGRVVLTVAAALLGRALRLWRDAKKSSTAEAIAKADPED